MLLAQNGIDVFYIDESGSADLFVVTSISIPLLRPTEDGRWRFVWKEYLDRYSDFRTELRSTHKIPIRKELHTSKLLSGGGTYWPKGRRFVAYT